MPLYSDLFRTPVPVALVTGSAAPRVGRAIAESLAEKGCAIAIHGNRSEEQGEQIVQKLVGEGVDAKYFSADLEQPGESLSLVDQVYSHFKRIDVVINSAAIWYPTPLESLEPSELEKFYRINSLATFEIARSAGLRMADQQRGGVIINLGDWAVIRPYPEYSAYFLSKGNLDTMTRMLAVELAERNRYIRVNAVLPGPVMIPADLDLTKKTEIINATLLKREGSPQNVAQACTSLIENDFITGVSLPVDGGRSIYSPYNPV